MSDHTGYSYRGVIVIVQNDGRYYASPCEMCGEFFDTKREVEAYIDYKLDC